MPTKTDSLRFRGKVYWRKLLTVLGSMVVTCSFILTAGTVVIHGQEIRGDKEDAIHEFETLSRAPRVQSTKNPLFSGGVEPAGLLEEELSPSASCGAAPGSNVTVEPGATVILAECTIDVQESGMLMILASGTVLGEGTEAMFRIGIDDGTGSLSWLEVDRYVDVYADGGDGTDKSVALYAAQYATPGTKRIQFVGIEYMEQTYFSVFDPTLSVLHFPDSDESASICSRSDDEDWSHDSTSYGVIRSCTMTFGEPGNVFVLASGSPYLLDESYTAQFRIAIDGDSDIYRYVHVYPDGIDGSDKSIALTYSKQVSAGSHTFELEGRRASGTGMLGVFDSTLIVVFIPDSNRGVANCSDAYFESYVLNEPVTLRECTFNMPADGIVLITADSSLDLESGPFEVFFGIGVDQMQLEGHSERWVNVYEVESVASVENYATSILKSLPAGEHTVYLLAELWSGSSAWVYNASINALAITNLTCHPLTLTHSGSGTNPTATPSNSTGCAGGQYAPDAVVELNATPSSGWSVQSWQGTDNDLSTSRQNRVTMPDEPHTVRVVYEEVRYKLDVAVSGSGSVSVLPNQATYAAGQVVQLTAFASVGWYFGGWSGDASGSDSPLQLTMNSDRSVTANFEREPCYPLLRGHTGSGSNPEASPSQSPGCSSGSYVAGATIDLLAEPDPGWSVVRWSGTASNTSTSTRNTVTMPAASRTVIVHYDRHGIIFLPYLVFEFSQLAAFPDLVNGKFDDLAQIGWTQSSIQAQAAGESLITSELGHGASPQSPPNAVWLGGFNNEEASISQSVFIPATAAGVKLLYHHWIASEDENCSESADRGEVLADGILLIGYNLCEAGNTPPWQTQVVSLEPFRGTRIRIAFRIKTDGAAFSNWYLDNLALCDDTASHPCQ